MLLNHSNQLNIENSNFQIQTFSVNYNKKISIYGKKILQSFRLKPYYYVVDDILYLLKFEPDECEYVLQILNSTVIYLQNNFNINFFDIYVYEIQIEETINNNNNNQNNSFRNLNKIIIRLAYQFKPIEETIETIW